MTNQTATDPVDMADLVQAAQAYLMRSDLIHLDRESVQAAHRLRCMLSQLAAGAEVPLPESRKAN